MKKIVAFFLFLIGFFYVEILPVSAQEKESVANLTKEYTQIKFTITCTNIADMDTIIESPKGKQYEVAAVNDNTMECIITAKEGDFVDTGDWIIKVSNDRLLEKGMSENANSNILSSQEEDMGNSAQIGNTPTNNIIPEIGSIKVVVEGSLEKIVDVNHNIVIATDIVGLKMYFRDETFVAEWTDTSCGDVMIKVTNADNMQVLDTQTVKDGSYELDINENEVSEIFVEIVPSVSKNIDGATNTYNISVFNHPDGKVAYEDLDITNKDSITATVTLNKPYNCEVWNNGKLKEKTETLDPGVHELTLKTDVGDNNFLIYIIDDAGNKRSSTKYVEKDVIAPYLQLVREYTDILTQEEIVTIEGKVEDQDYLRINDKDIEVEGDHTFRYDYKLKEGLNEINIEAGDIAGNVQSYLATVTYYIPVEKPNDIGKLIFKAIVIIFLIFFFIRKRKKRHSKGIGEERSSRNYNFPHFKLLKIQNPKKEFIKPNKYAIRRIFDIGIPFVTFIVIFTWLITMSVIQSSSMEPTLMSGSTVFYNNLAYVRNNIERGDIVIFWSKEKQSLLSKRVIGLPGDEISFQDGYVCINGLFADESAYLKENVETNCTETFIVPEKCYFMLGDNRENSFDSRYFDNPYISEADIRGKFLGQIHFSD